MTTDNHTAIATGAAANAATFNSPMGQLDAVMGDVDLLTTTAGTLTGAVNEHDTEIGNLAALTTSVKSSLVGAVNEHDAEIGNIAALTTTANSNLVVAVNELEDENDSQNALIAANSADIAELDSALFGATQAVASASTIVLSNRGRVLRVSGSTQINTITPFSVDESHVIYLICLAAWTLGTSGNIAEAYSPSLSEVVCLVYDSVGDTWYRVH